MIRWLRRVWSRLRFRRRLRPLPMPEGIVRLDVRVLVSEGDGKTHYHLRTTAGQAASLDDYAGVLCAMVAIGETIEDLRPTVRRDLRRLGRVLHNGKPPAVRLAS